MLDYLSKIISKVSTCFENEFRYIIRDGRCDVGGKVAEFLQGFVPINNYETGGTNVREVWFIMRHNMGGAKIRMKVRREDVGGKGAVPMRGLSCTSQDTRGPDRSIEAADIHPRPSPRKGTDP